MNDLLSRLSLSTEGAHAWEIDAHVWLGTMSSKEPRGKTKWFEYDEERKEHSVIEEWILAITENITTITLPMEITWQPCQNVWSGYNPQQITCCRGRAPITSI